ncbi:MAG: hypothetical protein RMJ43_10635 [Chloroherpetonaceae bacterium]|nr:hypothetical protein [Chthonomonadaceae bacterium]MDW8208286.1 hypothetical protein [Chloroherpetonaceae bacterium]
MQRRSWVLLGICMMLLLGLGAGYYLSTMAPPEFTDAEARQVLESMREAVRRKSVGQLMDYIAPDPEVRIAGLRPDQLRVMLARAFRGTGRLEPLTRNVRFQREGEMAVLEFDLEVQSRDVDMLSTPYSGHVTLRWKRVEVPRLLGLYRALEWRIVAAEHTGRDFNSFGEY